MATNLKNLSDHSEKNIINVANNKFAIIVSEWNDEVTESLFNGAYETLIENGVKKENIIKHYVPGSYELSLGAQWLAQKSDIDAVLRSQLC